MGDDQAVTLRKDPSIAQAVSECVFMGDIGRGHRNITPVGEYKFWTDPEAAKIVFETGLKTKMVGWDISVTYAVLGPEGVAELRAIGTSLAHFCIDIQKTLQQFALTRTGLGSLDLPDPIAMEIALDPSVAADTQQLFVAIETQSDLSRGQSVGDQLQVTGNIPNAEVVSEASHEKYKQILVDAVRRP